MALSSGERKWESRYAFVVPVAVRPPMRWASLSSDAIGRGTIP